MNILVKQLKRNVPLFVAGAAGIFLIYTNFLVGWGVFILAALIQNNLMEGYD